MEKQYSPHIKSDKFSRSRYIQLIKYQIKQNLLQYSIAALLCIGAIQLVYIASVCNIYGTENLPAETLEKILAEENSRAMRLTILISILTLIFGLSDWATEIRIKQKGIAFLMLPASMYEKFAMKMTINFAGTVALIIAANLLGLFTYHIGIWACDAPEIFSNLIIGNVNGSPTAIGNISGTLLINITHTALDFIFAIEILLFAMSFNSLMRAFILLGSYLLIFHQRILLFMDGNIHAYSATAITGISIVKIILIIATALLIWKRFKNSTIDNVVRIDNKYISVPLLMCAIIFSIHIFTQKDYGSDEMVKRFADKEMIERISSLRLPKESNREENFEKGRNTTILQYDEQIMAAIRTQMDSLIDAGHPGWVKGNNRYAYARVWGNGRPAPEGENGNERRMFTIEHYNEKNIISIFFSNW